LYIRQKAGSFIQFGTTNAKSLTVMCYAATFPHFSCSVNSTINANRQKVSGNGNDAKNKESKVLLEFPAFKHYNHSEKEKPPLLSFYTTSPLLPRVRKRGAFFV
jgi:hypothetical protein